MSVLKSYEVFLADVGTEIGVIVKDDGVVVDLSGATVKQIKFKKPSGTVVTKTATFKTDGTDGHLVYVTEEGFLDETGGWTGQAYVELPTPWEGHSSQFELIVKSYLA